VLRLAHLSPHSISRPEFSCTNSVEQLRERADLILLGAVRRIIACGTRSGRALVHEPVIMAQRQSRIPKTALDTLTNLNPIFMH
jgi:hypothetical protein